MTRLIHQTWKDSNIPGSIFRPEWTKSWRSLNDSWEYRLWTDDDIYEFVRTSFPDFFPIWCSYPKAIMRVDAWRYLVLKKLGGVYADLDFICLQPLDDWISCVEQFGCADQGDGLLCNAFMYAPTPGSSFLDGIESALTGASDVSDVLHATGPNFLTRYAASRRSLFYQFPSSQIFPIPYWEHDRCNKVADLSFPELARRFPKSSALTVWTNSWRDQPDTTPMLSSSEAPRLGAQEGNILIVLLTDSDREFYEASRSSWQTNLQDGVRVHHISFDAPEQSDTQLEILKSEGATIDSRLAAVFDWINTSKISFDWIFLTKDSTYIEITRLRGLIDPDYELIGDKGLLTNGMPSLDAGFFICASAISTINERIKNDRKKGRDSTFAETLSSGNIRTKADHRLRANFQQLPNARNDLATSSARQPDHLRLAFTILNLLPIRTVTAIHAEWSNKISFYDNGLFQKSDSEDCGEWTYVTSDLVKLRWFKWSKSEYFLPLRDESGDFSNFGLIIDEALGHKLLESRTTA